MGMTASLGRVILYTKKIDEMATFYGCHFGFERRDIAGDRIVELVGDGAALLLHRASARQKEGQVMVKLVFDVKDVRGFCETAKTNGLVFGPILKGDGYEFANAKDPAGNSISISSRAFVSL